jgi:hypothetical protein
MNISELVEKLLQGIGVMFASELMKIGRLVLIIVNLLLP